MRETRTGDKPGYSRFADVASGTQRQSRCPREVCKKTSRTKSFALRCRRSPGENTPKHQAQTPLSARLCKPPGKPSEATSKTPSPCTPSEMTDPEVRRPRLA